MELAVEGGDLGPVGGVPRRGFGVERGDGGLHLERPGRAAAEGVVEHGGALGDGVAVPAGAVLALEADRSAVGVGAGRPAGVGEQQQGEQAVGLGGVRDQLDDEPGEADRLLAEIGAHELVAGRGDVAFGVDEVQHVQHAAEPLG